MQTGARSATERSSMHAARPGLPGFDYVRATSRDEVVGLLAQHGDAARLMMGGTDLLVRMRDGVIRPRVVIDVKGLPGMRAVAVDGESNLIIGAAVTMNEVERHPQVRARWPLLAEAAGSVASYQVRNRATLGGNLCNASPAADIAPALLVLEGSIVLYGPKGECEVRGEEFFLGPGKAALGAQEFVTGVRIPAPPAGCAGRYLKLGRNRAGDLAVVGVAVLGFPVSDAPSGARFRIALASVAPVPLRADKAEQVLAASAPSEAAFAQAAEKAAEASAPIDDVRSSAAYRKAMVRNLTLRGLREVWEMVRST
jgi:CO/xanthine dehydrogenase FAD-binding subunit